MEETIDIKDIIKIIKKRAFAILTSIFGFLIVGAIVTFFIMTPQYEKSTQILVNQNQAQNNNENSAAEIPSSAELINTYNVIITSPAILENVIANTNFGGSVEELQAKIEVSSEEESQVVNVTVSDSSPERAARIANTLSETFEQEIPSIMNIDNVSILSEAQLTEGSAPVSPQPFLNLAIAFVVGLTFGIITAFLLEFLDKSIKTEQDIEKELELPILGVVPTMRDSEFNKSSNQTNSNKSMRSKNREERKTS